MLRYVQENVPEPAMQIHGKGFCHRHLHSASSSASALVTAGETLELEAPGSYIHLEKC